MRIPHWKGYGIWRNPRCWSFALCGRGNEPAADRSPARGFVAGERALATQILELLDRTLEDLHDHETAEPLEEEMVMSLGRT